MQIRGAATLDRLQRELERIYGLELPVRAGAFSVDAEAREQLRPEATAPEELMVMEEDDGMSLALYIDASVLERLEQGGATGARFLGELPAWATALEGVSHFVYLVHRQLEGTPVSRLELELQAEVDKFVAGMMTLWGEGRRWASAELRRRLFGEVSYRSDLSVEEGQRYRHANDLASRFARRLEKRHLEEGTPEGLLREARRVYRMGRAEKLSYLGMHG